MGKLQQSRGPREWRVWGTLDPGPWTATCIAYGLDSVRTSVYTVCDNRGAFRRHNMLVVSAKVGAKMPARVLVVDDDSDTRETVRMLLEDAGYVVLEAEDGAVALDVLRTSPD